MINVLHLRDTDRVCGPGKTIIETCARIDKTRYNLKIGLFLLESQKHNVYQEAAEKRGVEVVPIVTSSQFDLRIIFKIIDIIKAHDIHVLHSHEYKSDIIAFLVSRFYNIPIVTTAHGWIINGLKSRVYIGMGKRVLRYFDRVIAVSPKIYDELIRVKVPADHVQLIFNAIVTENYTPDAFEKHILRNRYGLPEDAFLFGNIGRLSPEKGQKEFIQGASRIAAEFPNCYFFLVGDGPDRANLENLVEQTGLQGRVFFTGHFHDVRPVFQDLDAVGLTSYTEGFPNVLLEALCMNKPIFATDVGGVNEIVIPGKTGLLIPPYDPGAVEESMRFILKNPEACKEQVSKGRALIEERYTFARRVAKVEELYNTFVR